MDGRALTFRLAGINNQNFLLRDEETGSYWQQISGRAIAGPLKGRRLELVHSDELTFGLWKSENPSATVLNPIGKYAPEYDPKDWETQYAKLKVVTKRDPGEPFEPRRIVLGIAAGGAARAFPVDRLLAQKLVLDNVGSEPVLIVAGPDNASLRAFRRSLPAQDGPPDFYRSVSGALLDSATGSQWNFQGCATSGPAAATCLQPLDAIKDYWFDWHLYHPHTTAYLH